MSFATIIKVSMAWKSMKMLRYSRYPRFLARKLSERTLKPLKDEEAAFALPLARSLKLPFNLFQRGGCES